MLMPLDHPAVCSLRQCVHCAIARDLLRPPGTFLAPRLPQQSLMGATFPGWAPGAHVRGLAANTLPLGWAPRARVPTIRQSTQRLWGGLPERVCELLASQPAGQCVAFGVGSRRAGMGRSPASVLPPGWAPGARVRIARQPIRQPTRCLWGGACSPASSLPRGCLGVVPILPVRDAWPLWLLSDA